ncbi:MAG: kinase [Pseudomonadota bacterium]
MQAELEPQWRALLEQAFGGDASAGALADATDASLPALWRCAAGYLAAKIMRDRARQRGSYLLAVSGGQGSGKSTLSQAVVQALASAGLRAGTLSLDDVYLTRAARQSLAANVHPLLVTRGVPGTHDLPLLHQVLQSLGEDKVHLPRFDKGIDDRRPPAQWSQLKGPVDVLIFEGWCVGVSAQPDADLLQPVNALERDEDPDGRYRRYVNEAISEHYEPLWAQFHAWLHLQVPDRAAVLRWREQQEQQLPAQQRMDATALDRFVAHYQRLTDWLRNSAPGRATWTLELGGDHELLGLQRGSERVQAPPVE